MGALDPNRTRNPKLAAQDASLGLPDSVRWVVLSVPDLNGTLRGKALARAGFTRGVQDGGLTTTDLVLRTDAADAPVVSVDGGLDGGDLRLVPDLATLVVDPWRPGWASCLAFTRWRDGSPCNVAPRDVCAAALTDLEEIGVTMHAAFEYEFRLYDRETGRLATPAASYSQQLLADLSGFVEDVAQATRVADIDLQAFHTEAGQGLVELAVAPRDGLRAADTAVRLRGCVQEAAARHGMRASFAAKPVAKEEGSGGHLHLTLNDPEGRSLFASDVIAGNPVPEVMRHAIAGVLEHLGAMSVFYNPHINSYKRLLPGWFAPTRADWAIDDRDAAVRLVVGERAQATHLELRRAGADSNPYLVLAAAAVSIADGLQQRIEPPADGLLGAAPGDLRLALAAFADDADARARLGERFCRHWEATREWELRAFNKVVTAWELTRAEARTQ
jgi:glutamine synthetase